MASHGPETLLRKLGIHEWEAVINVMACTSLS